MSFAFRSPSLSAQTAEGQIQQLFSFLRQLVQQLNWVLKNLDDGEEAALTEDQLSQACGAVSQSAEVFQTLSRKIARKQAQENFVGAGKKTVFADGAWTQGASVNADMEAVGRYTLFVAVCGDVPVVCARQGDAICGDGLHLTCGAGGITVTAAPAQVTALYAII